MMNKRLQTDGELDFVVRNEIRHFREKVKDHRRVFWPPAASAVTTSSFMWASPKRF